MGPDLNRRHGKVDAGHVVMDDGKDTEEGYIVNSGKSPPAFKIQLGAFPHAYHPITLLRYSVQRLV